MISITEALLRDDKAAPNATDFCHHMRRLAKKLPQKDRAVFLTAAIRAAELCGKTSFAWHLAVEFQVDPWQGEDQ